MNPPPTPPSPAKPLKAAVILSYGAGNGPDSLDAVFKTAIKNNMVLLNITQCLKGCVEDDYATVSKLNVFIDDNLLRL